MAPLLASCASSAKLCSSKRIISQRWRPRFSHSPDNPLGRVSAAQRTSRKPGVVRAAKATADAALGGVNFAVGVDHSPLEYIRWVHIISSMTGMGGGASCASCTAGAGAISRLLSHGGRCSCMPCAIRVGLNTRMAHPSACKCMRQHQCQHAPPLCRDEALREVAAPLLLAFTLIKAIGFLANAAERVSEEGHGRSFFCCTRGPPFLLPTPLLTSKT